MVEIRIAVADVAVAEGLVRRLAGLLDLSSVSLDGEQSEVSVRSVWESSAVLEVIGAVESWLADDGVAGYAELSIGDRSYTMVGPGRPATPSGSAA